MLGEFFFTFDTKIIIDYWKANRNYSSRSLIVKIPAYNVFNVLNFSSWYFDTESFLKSNPWISSAFCFVWNFLGFPFFYPLERCNDFESKSFVIFDMRSYRRCVIFPYGNTQGFWVLPVIRLKIKIPDNKAKTGVFTFPLEKRWRMALLYSKTVILEKGSAWWLLP